MRAATPKADPNLRPATAPERRVARNPDTLHAFAATDLAGIRPFRPNTALGDSGWERAAANDAARSMPRPVPPLLLGALVMLLDGALLIGAGLLADILTQDVPGRHDGVTLLISVLTVAGGLATGAYDHPMLFSFRRQLRRIGIAAVAALGATICAAAAFGALWRLDPAWLMGSIAVAGLLLTGGRAATAGALRALPRSARRTVILGTGPQAARLAASLARDPAGLVLLGAVDEHGGRAVETPNGVPLLGGLPQLGAMIRRGEVDVVALAVPWSDEARITALMEFLSAYPVEVRLAPDLAADRVVNDGAPAIPLLCARPISGLGACLKVVMDYALALTALLVAAVPMLLIALAVRLDSPGPILFRQRRTGFNDQPFDVFKFRTMYAHATDHEAACQVVEGDQRVTRVGAILRRTSLDELPQLFNVLRGEMSFVGPRPHAPGTRAGGRLFDEVVANYAARHRVKPGLTGLAQVRGYRGPTPTEREILKRVESDLEYIANWSPWLDIVIVLRTLLVVVRMRNAL